MSFWQMLNNYTQKFVLGLAAIPKVCYKKEIFVSNFFKRLTFSAGALYLLIEFLKVNLKLEQICQLWTE